MCFKGMHLFSLICNQDVVVGFKAMCRPISIFILQALPQITQDSTFFSLPTSML